MLVLFALVASVPFMTAASDRVPRSCGTCNVSACDPLPTDGCEFGKVQDSCGCCWLCGAGLGEPCGGRGSSAKRCAAGMECVKSDKAKKGKVGVCVCKSDYEVCGTDGVTYKNGCDLKAASLRAVDQKKTEIKVYKKGKCAQAPAIVTSPVDVWNVTGSQVYLSCEAIGIPTPVLTWKKILSNKGKTDLLPGDKDNLAIQTRGGPEKHEVTGWVLISPLTEDEDGSYECHATNSKGEASAVGTIHVVKSLDDIPAKKEVIAGKEEEL
ncbi:hypothetical protein SKAU_G00030710 [Synaphobranchus kaupii]|uniref:Insulin-like growth factor binding protein 7 n=1 Tax=Synaphobranchus kaupii TaxID=118154 RepID=A0A9Q1GEV7_SYNKA|nr:hypothetical protein SKAU_G00030710 [Synaphobranchus kaupii]